MFRFFSSLNPTPDGGARIVGTRTDTVKRLNPKAFNPKTLL